MSEYQQGLPPQYPPAYPPPYGHTQVVVQQNAPGMFVRGLWYVCIGWWAAGFAVFAAAALTITVVGLPAALWIYNRLPRVLTLRPAGVQVVPTGYGVQVRPTEQYPMWLRALYFVVAGWWVSMTVAMAAWMVSLTLIGIPASLWMLNRLPEVTTLRRN